MDVDWGSFYCDERSSSELASMLEKITSSLMDKAYPLAVITVKSTDDPWITPRIRTMIKKRKKIFRKKGRGEEWKAMKKETDRMIKEQKGIFYQNQKTIATTSRDPRKYFQAVSKLKDKEKPPSFNLQSIFPGESNGEIASRVVEYFSGITASYAPLSEKVNKEPYHNSLEAYQISAKIKSMKKTRSMVKFTLS
jgi:hypothetical protein